MAGYDKAGVLQDTYGAAFAGGQRFFTWTDDAFNPTAWGVSTRVLPSSAPELLSIATPNVGGGYGMSNVLRNVGNWDIIHSPVLWILIGIVALIPLYHYLEYGK